MKQREKSNKLERKKYAKEPREKARKKETYQKKKDIKDKKRQEYIKLASKGLNCDGKEEEYVVEELEVKHHPTKGPPFSPENWNQALASI